MLALSDKDLTNTLAEALLVCRYLLFPALALWCLLWDEVLWPRITAIWHSRFCPRRYFRNDGNRHRHGGRCRLISSEEHVTWHIKGGS